MKLTGKHNRSLRAIAGRMKLAKTLNTIQLNEVTSQSLSNIDISLASHEMVLLRMLTLDKKSAAKELGLSVAEKTNSTVVQTVGHTVLLYRPTNPPSAVSRMLQAELLTKSVEED